MKFRLGLWNTFWKELNVEMYENAVEKQQIQVENIYTENKKICPATVASHLKYTIFSSKYDP